MAGWHHWLDGREFEYTPGVGDRQGGWRAGIHGVAKSQTRLSDCTELMGMVKPVQGENIECIEQKEKQLIDEKGRARSNTTEVDRR